MCVCVCVCVCVSVCSTSFICLLVLVKQCVGHEKTLSLILLLTGEVDDWHTHTHTQVIEESCCDTQGRQSSPGMKSRVLTWRKEKNRPVRVCVCVRVCVRACVCVCACVFLNWSYKTAEEETFQIRNCFKLIIWDIFTDRGLTPLPLCLPAQTLKGQFTQITKKKHFPIHRSWYLATHTGLFSSCNLLSKHYNDNKKSWCWDSFLYLLIHGSFIHCSSPTSQVS